MNRDGRTRFERIIAAIAMHERRRGAILTAAERGRFWNACLKGIF